MQLLQELPRSSPAEHVRDVMGVTFRIVGNGYSLALQQ